MTRSLRAGLPLIALAVAVALALSDWPIGWGFWVRHPYLAAFAAGAALLFFAGAVIDNHFRRREARRWHGLGFAAAGEFASIHYDIGITMAALIGADDGYRLRSEVEFHLATARDRAAELLPRDIESDVGLGSDERLAVLVTDSGWRRSCSQTLRVARAHLVEAISRWTGTFAILNDDEQFNRVARTVAIMDLITALHMTLVAIRLPDDEANLDATGFSTFAMQWRSLVNAVNTELDFWNARRDVGNRVALPGVPRDQPPDRSLISSGP